MKPKALHLHKIPGLEYTEDSNDAHRNWGAYKWRNKWEDMEATKAFYDEYPPEVGDLVVVLHTASGYQMLRPDVKPIIAITKQKRLVVEHIHELYAGKSFWRTGQNCKAPRGQCWLVPAELYRDIPFSKSRSTDSPAEPPMRLAELIPAYGGKEPFMARAKVLMEQYRLSADEAQAQIEREYKDFMYLRARRKGTTMEQVQKHQDHFLAQGKDRHALTRKSEGEMVNKGQKRGVSRLQNWVGGRLI